MYDDSTLEYKCKAVNCAGFAEFAITDQHGNHAGNLCRGCEEALGGDLVGGPATSSVIERGIGEHWEIAEQLGWVNPIDTLFDKYGVDCWEDLPEHEQDGYPDAVDESEGDAIAYIEKHFSGYIKQKGAK